MIRDLIPAPARKVIYVVFGALITIESSLDGLEAGVVSGRTQGIIVAVMAGLGFTLAAVNTGKA